MLLAGRLTARAGPAAIALEDEMYAIKLDRNPGGDGPVVIWLWRVSPQSWGDRERAGKFADKAEARRAAAGMKLAGAWSLEEA